MMITKFAVVDIETTHTNSTEGTIVEVGICCVDLENKKFIKLLDTIVREPNFKNYNAWIFDNSSLTIEDVLNAPEWVEIQPKIIEIFKRFPVTAYRKLFDFTWLKHRGVYTVKELPDPMLESTNILKLSQLNPELGEYKWPKVEECWQYYFPNIPYRERHRAYDDCIHEAAIIYEMYRRGHYILEIE